MCLYLCWRGWFSFVSILRVLVTIFAGGIFEAGFVIVIFLPTIILEVSFLLFGRWWVVHKLAIPLIFRAIATSFMGSWPLSFVVFIRIIIFVVSFIVSSILIVFLLVRSIWTAAPIPLVFTIFITLSILEILLWTWTPVSGWIIAIVIPMFPALIMTRLAGTVVPMIIAPISPLLLLSGHIL